MYLNKEKTAKYFFFVFLPNYIIKWVEWINKQVEKYLNVLEALASAKPKTTDKKGGFVLHL